VKGGRKRQTQKKGKRWATLSVLGERNLAPYEKGGEQEERREALLGQAGGWERGKEKKKKMARNFAGKKVSTRDRNGRRGRKKKKQFEREGKKGSAERRKEQEGGHIVKSRHVTDQGRRFSFHD